MRKVTRILKGIGLFLLVITWCAVQTVIGALLTISLLPFSRVQRYRGMIVLYHPFRYTFSLGTFAFISDRTEDGLRVRGRMYGHFVQSCVCGPYFFFVVTFPQLIVRIPAIRKRRAERGISTSDLFSDKHAVRFAARFGE